MFGNQDGITLDSFTVSLPSPNGRYLPAVRAVQGDRHWPQKECVISHWSCVPTIPCHRGSPNLYLDQPNTKRLCQPIGSHASYLTDSPNATRLELCYSLGTPRQMALNSPPYAARYAGIPRTHYRPDPGVRIIVLTLISVYTISRISQYTTTNRRFIYNQDSMQLENQPSWISGDNTNIYAKKKLDK